MAYHTTSYQMNPSTRQKKPPEQPLPKSPTREQIDQANSGPLSDWVEAYAPDHYPSGGTITVNQWRDLVWQLATHEKRRL